jgi:hypothetical protein
VPPKLAHRVVLRHLPRILRAGLDRDGIYGRVPAALARDAGVMDPGLGAVVEAWIEDVAGHGLPARHEPSTGDAAPALPRRSPRDVLARILSRFGHRRAAPEPAQAAPVPPDPTALASVLDRYATNRDSAGVREMADAVLLLTAPVSDLRTAKRLAAAVWREIPRIDETAAILRLRDLAAAYDDDDEAFATPFFDAPMEASAQRSEAERTAWHEAVDAAIARVRVEARALALGLSAISVGQVPRYYGSESIAGAALSLGESVLQPVERLARAEERSRLEQAAARKPDALDKLKAMSSQVDEDPGLGPEVPEGHVLVCRALGVTGAGKGRDVTKGYERAIGHPLPLIRTPDLALVRRILLAEFPQAEEAIDFALRDLVGRPYVRMTPLLIVGPPGGGKSRFLRRLGELLGVGVLRVDGSNDAGASFGGTERRWYSSEPCRPFMAVNRFLQANPLVLVDELDKAPVRSDYGRLWDGVISFLETETASRFPDPCIQAELDLSWVSTVFTANATWSLPAPLVDRLRIVEFPLPGPEHLDQLLPALLADIARGRGLDARWFQAPDGIELAALRSRWGGGSVRLLRRLLEGVLRVRERTALRH